MKKLTIFPILLIFSITAFAQEKSPNSETFSLIQYSKDNNRNFFNFSDLFHNNLLFYKDKKSNSREHQDFQIPGFHRSSEKNYFLGNSAFESRKQNWEDMFNPSYGQQEDRSSEEKSVSLAEVHLKRLAERTKKGRKIGGPIAIVLGGVCVGLGAWVSRPEEDGEPLAGAMIIMPGALMVAAGISAFAVPSRAERELKEVLEIPNPAARERAGHRALSFLASRARKRRIITGAIAASGAAVFLIGYPEEGGLPLALLFGSIGVLQFVLKTGEEKAYQNYLNEREQQKELRLRLGLGPNGKPRISLVLSF